MRPVTPLRAVACACALLALPADAAAQKEKEQFFDGLLPLYAALAGTYGDEGRELTARVEALGAALTRWDAALAASERDLRAQLRAGDDKTALQVHTVLASMYLDRGRFDEALRELDEDLRIDPRRAAFHRFRALALRALNRPREASAAFASAFRAAGDDPTNAYYAIAGAQDRSAGPQDRSAGPQDPPYSAAETMAALATLSALEEALRRGTAARADAPFLSLRPIADDAGGAIAFAPAAYAPAFASILRGDLATGVNELRRAVASDPLVTDPALRLEPAALAIVALRQGRVGDALRHLDNGIALAPGSAQLHRILGIACGISGDAARAVRHLREAVRLAPGDERSWLALARTLDDTGDSAAAAEALRTAVAALPASGELRWQLTVVAGKRQRTDEADLDLVATADRLVVLAGTGEFLGRIAALAQAHLDYDRAVALLEQRVLLTPNNADAHRALGRAYAEQGRLDEGYAELVMALWLDPRNGNTLAALGRVHLDAGRNVPAVDTLTRAVDLAPDNAEIVYALGDALTRAGRPDEGRRLLQEAERLRARAVETQRRLRTAGMLSLEAELHLSEGRHEQAIAAWNQVMEMQGRSAASHLRLAEVFRAAGRLEDAATQLQLAIAAQAPPDAYRRLADILAALGRADESATARRTYTELRLKELSEN